MTRHVSAALKKEKLLLGGESSGHIICNDYLSTGDGVFAALRVAETLFFMNNWSMNTFDRYPQIMINVPITSKKDLMLDPCASLIEDAEKLLHQGRVLVRYSGTELLLRVMVEDDDGEHAQMICLKLSKELQTVL